MEEQELEQPQAKPPKGSSFKSHPIVYSFKQALMVLRNKYALTIVVFLVWLTFFDRYNLVDMLQNTSKIGDMKDEMDYYRTKITEDSTRIQELTSNNENLEKYAREQYLMKHADEEIFIVK